MIRSMTAFASARGTLGAFGWMIELRGVNAKGLDLRLRVPDWLTGLEAALRADLGAALARGSVSMSLRLARSEEQKALTVNPAALEAALTALAETERAAIAQGVTLAPSRATDVLAMRGVLDATVTEEDPAPLVAALRAEMAPVVAAFVEMRETEGAALAEVLRGQLSQVEALTAQAAAQAEDRREATAQTLRTNLARVLDNADGADEARVAQELALIAVKADVTEEIDRLGAHVSAARDLLDTGGPVGRKLDFLMQEFNREANTLCSKAQSKALTATGLELKAVIDQMREQVQNVE